MKTINIWIILFLAVASMLAFQSIWLHNAYKSKRNEIEHNINIKFKETVEKEVDLRYKKLVAEEKEGMLYSDEKPPEDGYTINEEELLESGIYQQILKFKGVDLDIIVLDSIFKEKLAGIGFPLNYSLCYKDSTGTIIDQTGNLPQSKIDKAFHSEPLLIVDGKRVRAIVNITPFAVFKQMILLLVASVVILIVIMSCVFSQTKTIFNEYKLNKLRRDFTSALTHDMKTPLSTIKSVLSNYSCGLLDKFPEKREKQEKLAMNEIENLLSLVNKMLTISQIEDGKFILNKTKADIFFIIKELEERFSVWKNKSITISSSVDLDEDFIIYIDEELIKNAISNLIENAIKYSGDSVTINIRSFTSNDNLFIIVHDNGIGFSEKNKHKIFKKFERLPVVRKMGVIGFGMGLSYVKQVIKLHGGIVNAHGEEGEYSEFSIVLPLNKIGIEGN